MITPAYCNGCGKRLEVPAGYGKSKIRCPDCGVFTDLPKELREQGQAGDRPAAPPPPPPTTPAVRAKQKQATAAPPSPEEEAAAYAFREEPKPPEPPKPARPTKRAEPLKEAVAADDDDGELPNETLIEG